MLSRILDHTLAFIHREQNRLKVGYPSVAEGARTLYGTCYGLLTLYYLGAIDQPDDSTTNFLFEQQCPETGAFVGPEFAQGFHSTRPNFDADHLRDHLACTVLGAMETFDLVPKYPLTFAHRFMDRNYLTEWLEQRDMTDAWLEGNNLLFAGQLLIYLRDQEKQAAAQDALNLWFDWLNNSIDPRTGLWGTDGDCSPFVAMCGGYHQLLVYYYENGDVKYPNSLVDVVLSLQHDDGGFSPQGGGGACEDVDAVDILVNMYKVQDYRRSEIRIALRRCLRLILSQQNSDGGFPYKRDMIQSHMGIAATHAEANVSCMFPTWFRVHTLALIADILTDEPVFRGWNTRFNKRLSMGWHRKWSGADSLVPWYGRAAETFVVGRNLVRRVPGAVRWRARRIIKRASKAVS